MYPVIMAQWLKDKRKPFTIIIFIVLSIVATIIFGDSSRFVQTSVAIFSTEENATEIEEKWANILNKESNFEFIIMDEETARQKVSEGRNSVAIRVMENDYRLITASTMPDIKLIEQEVHRIFEKEARLNAAANSDNVVELREEVDAYLEEPPIKVVTESISEEELPRYDMGLQLLFGFTLFSAMFIIGFKVNGINENKVNGIWNRLILSPVSKTSMYVGHLVYSFIIGFFQILVVFLIFHFIMGYDLGNLWMIIVISAVFTLSMVSVAMLFTGFANTPEKFYMIYPSIIPIIPIISNVYMPPGTISNPVIQFISNLFPLSHAVEAMMEVALFDTNWTEIALPISLMLLIGVVAMGIGINIVERLR